MDDVVELWEKPAADEVYMLAGWQQWADAGSISSELPRYLVEHLAARQIGRIRPGGSTCSSCPACTICCGRASSWWTVIARS